MELQYGLPRNLLSWADQHQDQLKPPVCNASLFPDGNFIINLVGGPNGRTDFHDNPGEEIFHQIKGNAYLNIWDRGRFEKINLKEGDVFLLPAHVKHSPQRPEAGSLCFLVEKPRPQGEKDAFRWYCPKCAEQIWFVSVQLSSLVDDLPKAFNIFYALSDQERLCPKCGTIHPGKDFVAWHAMQANT
jgi:3-hydroxyanthranilate 3,4-dioxygenase